MRGPIRVELCKFNRRGREPDSHAGCQAAGRIVVSPGLPCAHGRRCTQTCSSGRTYQGTQSLIKQQDLIVGFQTNGRLEKLDGDRVLGMHNMILPLRVKLPDGSWLDLVRLAFEAERDLLPHRRYPLVELRKVLGRQQLFDTVFNYMHFHVFQSLSSLPDMEVLGSWGIERSHYTLRAEFNRNPFTGEMQFDLNFNSSLISMERVRQIAGCYERVFQAMAEQPNASHER